MIRKNLSLLHGILAANTLLAAASHAGEPLPSEAQLSLQSRFALLKREFRETPASDREQAALGLILEYKSGQLADFLQLGIAGYHVEKLWADGRRANDLLPLEADGRQDRSLGKVGELYAVAEKDQWSATIGRQQVKTLLLSSSNQRAIPNTYQGIKLRYTLATLTFSSQWYNRWSSRHDDRWQEFETDLGAKINYLWVNSLAYKKGALSVELERSESRHFLVKWGLRSGYKWTLSNGQKLSVEAGYLTSSDAGPLFVVGAEADELDDEDGAATGTRSRNNGAGLYGQITWNVDNWAFAVAASQFDDAWIEDNFAGDHGTNPFPTRSIIYPDFSNANERALLGRIEYNWRRWVPGLTTTFTYVEGTGITNSVDRSLGTATERYRDWYIVYQPGWLKGLSLQWRHHAYESKKIGNVDGVKGDDTDDRVFIDYTWQF